MTPDEAYSLETYKKAVKEAADFCRQNGLGKILADIKSSGVSMPVVDKFDLGIEIANILGSRIQMAILAPASLIDKLGENTAINRGGRVFVTSSRKQALAWLKGK
jgi:hypothetical protein